MVLVVNAELPIHSLQDLVALARSRQGGLSFGSLGVGSAAHLSGEYLKRSLNIDLTHVPYRGVAPSLNDVAAGHIAFMFNDILNALPLMQAGKLRPIGVTAARRAGALPDVPALSEIGLPTFDIGIRLALFAPAKTPEAVINRLEARNDRINQ